MKQATLTIGGMLIKYGFQMQQPICAFEYWRCWCNLNKMMLNGER